jgi:hypothetical protein
MDFVPDGLTEAVDAAVVEAGLVAGPGCLGILHLDGSGGEAVDQHRFWI